MATRKGRISWNQKSVNNVEFKQILGKWIIPSIEIPDEGVADVVFHHGNAPAHTTKVNKHYMDHN